jgi:SAM-dependent methyltransferase
MFRWLKRPAAGPVTALAMIGPKPADAVLFVGISHPAAAAGTGAVTRLNGRTVVAAEGPAAAALTERAAGQEGALVEFADAPADALPFEAATFRIVVLTDLATTPADRRAAVVGEAVRVLEPGGRVIVMVGGAGPGWLGRFVRQPGLEKDVVLDLLLRAGLAATRRLAEADRVAYYEGRKARP